MLVPLITYYLSNSILSFQGNDMGQVNGKSAFEDAQNAQIQIILDIPNHPGQVPHSVVYNDSVIWTVKAEVTLRIRAVSPEPPMFTCIDSIDLNKV